MPDEEEEEGNSFVLVASLKNKLKPGETINVLAGSPENIFIGCSLGTIVNIKNVDGVLKANCFKLTVSTFARTSHVSSQDGSVTQIEYVSALGVILVLQNGVLIEFDLESCQPSQIQDNVTSFALNSDPTADDPFTIELAIASGKNIHICRKTSSGKLEKTNKITCDGVVKTLAYARHTVCFANATSYFIYENMTKNTLPLFSIDETIKPVICTIDSHEFLLFGLGLAMFVTDEGTSLRPPLIFHHPNSTSCVFHPPNLYIHGEDGLSVYGIDDQKLESSLPNKNQISTLVSLEGKILGANNSDIFILKRAGFAKRIENFEARGDIEKALNECRVEFQKNPTDELVEMIKSLQLKIGEKQLYEGNFEDAKETFLQGDVTPEKVITLVKIEDVDVLSTNLPPQLEFLKEYLMDVEEKVDGETKQKVEETLYHLGIFTMDFSNWTTNEHVYKANLLEKKSFHHEAAKHFYAAGRINQSISLWSTVLNDNEQSLKPENIFECVDWNANVKDRIQLLQWLFETHPEKTLEFLETSSLLNKLECCQIFEKNSAIFKKFLLNNQDVPELQSPTLNFLIEKASSGDREARLTLRKLICNFIQHNGNIHYEVVVNLKKPGYELEHSMANSKPTLQEAKDVLSSLLQETDYDTAEKYVELHLNQYSELLETLFSFYKRHSPEMFRNRGMKFLDCISPSQNVLDLLNEVPNNFKFAEISNFIKRAVAVRQSKNSSDYISRVAQSYVIKKSENKNIESKPIYIRENEKCKVCLQELELKHGNLVYLPTGFVIHASCFRNPRLCPITNNVF